MFALSVFAITAGLAEMHNKGTKITGEQKWCHVEVFNSQHV